MIIDATPPKIARLRRAGLVACCLLVAPATAAAAEAADSSAEASARTNRDPADPSLMEMSLQELMDIQVTSVSRRPEKAGEAAAAVHVITAEDIRRSGMTSLPDILRLAPGVNVAQAHNGQWAVSIRGFNDAYSSKLLVLVDGRPIYSAAYAGVLWFAQDLALEEIERIEIIRGPGAAVWGANAVNGVINIITKPAVATQGTLISLAGGDQARRQATLGFGGPISNSAAFRIYLKDVRDPSLRTPTGTDGGDPSRHWTGGYRIDWSPSDRDHLTAAGQYMAVHTQVTVNPGRIFLPIPAPIPTGSNGLLVLPEQDQSWFLQLGWERSLANGSFSTQAYIQRDRIGQVGGVLRMVTAEGEARYHVSLGERHDVVVGAGYRHRAFNSADGPLISIVATAPARALEQVSLFGQDSIALTSKLSLTAGVRAEHTTETGWEFEPSFRVAWTPSSNQTVWASASRAVRSPSIGDRGLRLFTPVADTQVPTMLLSLGDPNAKSETETSLEAGYRVMVSPRLSLDLAAFASRYGRLYGFVLGAPFLENNGPIPFVVIPAQSANVGKGRTYGVELSGSWQVTDRWRLTGNYSVLHMRYRAAANVIPDLNNDQGKSPRSQYQLRSQLDLPHEVEFDAAVYHVGRLATGPIPAYTRLDLRLGWRPTDHLELALVGQNLLEARHPEITSMVLRDREEVPRSVFVQLQARF